MESNVILESLVGSTAYGLNTSTSDRDYLGIYLEPAEYFLGLNLRTDRDLSRVTREPDRSLHELGKFCRLALQCNPTVTELLWVPADLLTVTSRAGDSLREYRESFLSAELVKKAYLGYATSQLQRLQERGDFGSDLKNRTAKHARHLMRLLHQGYTLYTTGELPIRLEDPEKYHRFGAYVSFDSRYATEAMDEYRDKFENSSPAIPEKADRDKVEELIQWIREVY